MQALLNIDNYFVEDISIRTNPGYKKAKAEQGALEISFDIKRKGTEPRFMVLMQVDVNKSKKSFSGAAYQISLKIIGFFSFVEGTAEETMNKMIGLNGLTILYGVSRGIVAQATANCPHGKFILPSVNFVELLKKKAQATERQARAQTKKK
jgi:preprotein translocase subunit SecB